MHAHTSELQMSTRVVGLKYLFAVMPSHCGTSWIRPVVMLASAIAGCCAFGPSIAASYEMPSAYAGIPVFSPELPARATRAHSEVVAAGFGVQAAGASTIMVRTYDASTGDILSDESFDLSIKEEGAAEAGEEKGRIFAGGIGVDQNGKSTFMLSAYDAETGKFLWEGQLNLLKVGDQKMTKTKASITRSRTSALLVADGTPKAFDTLFALRAVNPVTGGLIWQDQFAPGRRRHRPADGTSIGDSSTGQGSTPIAHVFDLIVRTYDHNSGRLLWEDSFEQVDQDKEVLEVPETNQRPQAIPFRHIPDGPAPLVRLAVFR